MPLKFNPFSGNFDFTGSGGGGGGSSFFTGEVATYADLPLDGTAPLNSRWLVRSNSGTWPFSSYKQAGVYVRAATGGTDRDADYTLTDTSFHDVMSDDAFLIFDNTDPTKAAKFDVGANVSAGQTRVVSFPDKNITLDDASDSRTPSAHASSHFTGGSDPIELTDLAATGSTLGHVLTSDGDGTASFQPSAGGGSADDYEIKTTSYTASNGDRIAADTSSGAFTITLPSSPTNGDTVYFLDYARTFDTNNLTIARNGSNIESLAEDLVCETEDAAFSLVYVGSTVGWKVVPFQGTAIPSVRSDATGITGAAAITNIVTISQANYDALGTYDATTVYIITDP